MAQVFAVTLATGVLPSPASIRRMMLSYTDAVIFIYRDEVYDKATRYHGTAELIVGIQRNGPVATCACCTCCSPAMVSSKGGSRDLTY